MVSKYKRITKTAKADVKFDENKEKFELYKDFQKKIKYIQSYQILALNRGKKLNVLSIGLNFDENYF